MTCVTPTTPSTDQEHRSSTILRLAARPTVPTVLLITILVVGALARLAPLGLRSFHEDEALYAAWALPIAYGEDVWLARTPVDKPPVFLYLEAGAFALFGPSETAGRLVSLAASVASIGLLYCLTRRIIDRPTALIAAALLAGSPFAIAFAPTAFLDSLMTMWVLAACASAVSGRWGWAGILLGLAGATKWEGITFLPLALGLAWCSSGWPAIPLRRKLRQAGLGLAAVGLPVWVWDVARPQPSILRLLGSNYGGLGLADLSSWGPRLSNWLGFLRYVFYHPWLNGLFLAGLPCVLLADLITVRRGGSASARLVLRLDLLLVAFLGLYVVGLTLSRVPVWDRYLVGLIPVGCLFLARALWLPLSRAQAWWASRSARYAGLRSVAPSLVAAAFLLITLPLPLRDASIGRFPIGGDLGVYQGFDQVVAYFRGHVLGGAILYHRWLGNHYRFYMYRFPYAFRWWQTGDELARDAAAAADVDRWIVFPSWQDDGPARASLSAEGLRLTLHHTAYRDDGSLGFTIYQIEGP